MFNPGEIAYEQFIDEFLSKGICPYCNAKIGYSLDGRTKEKIYICICGWTKIRK